MFNKGEMYKLLLGLSAKVYESKHLGYATYRALIEGRLGPKVQLSSKIKVDNAEEKLCGVVFPIWAATKINGVGGHEAATNLRAEMKTLSLLRLAITMVSPQKKSGLYRKMEIRKVINKDKQISFTNKLSEIHDLIFSTTAVLMESTQTRMWLPFTVVPMLDIAQLAIMDAYINFNAAYFNSKGLGEMQHFIAISDGDFQLGQKIIRALAKDLEGAGFKIYHDPEILCDRIEKVTMQGAGKLWVKAKRTVGKNLKSKSSI